MPSFRCVDWDIAALRDHDQDADAWPVVCVGDAIASDAEEGFLRSPSPPPGRADPCCACVHPAFHGAALTAWHMHERTVQL